MPEISTVPQFIQSRHATVLSGELTRFQEMELSATTEVFGNIAHRFSAYAKSGTLRGVTFHTRGAISTQFIRTPAGRKISAMAWDDERPGYHFLKRTFQQSSEGSNSGNLRATRSEPGGLKWRRLNDSVYRAEVDGLVDSARA